MLDYLRAQTGKRMVGGQVDLPDLKWVAENSGRTPKILGLDFMSYTSQMGKHVENTQIAIDWVKKHGGLVTFQWHWVSPTGAKDLGKGFYTGSTDFDLAATLAAPQSAGYRALLSDIDDVAAELKKLATAKVPVLFRPLHEAQGRWFWWGAKGPEACVALYRLIFDRFTRVHGLHNIAWVWNVYPASQDKGDPVAWYPGNSIVDVVATDYLQDGLAYRDLVHLTDGHKIVALAETMNPPLPQKSFADGAMWSYWVAWARRDWNKNRASDMKASMTAAATVTLESKR